MPGPAIRSGRLLEGSDSCACGRQCLLAELWQKWRALGMPHSIQCFCDCFSPGQCWKRPDILNLSKRFVDIFLFKLICAKFCHKISTKNKIKQKIERVKFIIKPNCYLDSTLLNSSLMENIF
ncbi:hypothetical protein BpHYR1_016384 [Brachionus plicatilis]|uniref:Uncharacterized protein n=1 Tax=Brachionus plicatilis TaxID=10195 RepID=A0A3M7SXD6_BRAPC|nr:hypothetical protein BpHYR1_016384 [Brachionus plicatilis]